MEILKDFSGWSWDKSYDKTYDYIDNLIYQNLLIMLGEKFLFEWRTYGSTRRDFLEEAKDFVKFFTGNDKYLNCIYILLQLKGKKNKKKEFNEAFINSQKEFLYFISKKINKIQTIEELIDIIYELRYYKMIRISKDAFISDMDDLEDYIDKVLKKAITKLCKMGGMKIISMDINLNFEIIKYALDTRIIELEKTKVYFDTDDDKNLIIKVFDKDVFEKQGRKKINISKKTLEVRMRRKIKLFI